MIIDKRTEGYSEEMTLSFEDFINFIEKIELKHLIKTLILNPNPSMKVKLKIETNWEERANNNFVELSKKYEERLFLYKFIKTVDKPLIFSSFQKIKEERIKRLTNLDDYGNAFLNKVMNEKRIHDHYAEKEISELNKVNFEEPFLISELQTYYLATEILNANIIVKNRFVNKYINFEDNTFLEINLNKTSNKKEKAENYIRELTLNARKFTIEMYCKEHDNLFCRKCYYKGNLHKKNMLQHFVDEATEKNITSDEAEKRNLKLLLFNILNNADSIETSQAYNEITEEIKQNMRSKFLF